MRTASSITSIFSCCAAPKPEHRSQRLAFFWVRRLPESDSSGDAPRTPLRRIRFAVASRRMLFAAVVDTSRRVSETSRRLEKIDLLATLLRQLDLEEVEIVVAILSGY